MSHTRPGSVATRSWSHLEVKGKKYGQFFVSDPKLCHSAMDLEMALRKC